MALNPLNKGALASIEQMIEELEGEELVTRRRMDTGAAHIEELEQGGAHSALIYSARLNFAYQRERWEYASRALSVLKRRRARLEEGGVREKFSSSGSMVYPLVS